MSILMDDRVLLSVDENTAFKIETLMHHIGINIIYDDNSFVVSQKEASIIKNYLDGKEVSLDPNKKFHNIEVRVTYDKKVSMLDIIRSKDDPDKVINKLFENEYVRKSLHPHIKLHTFFCERPSYTIDDIGLLKFLNYVEHSIDEKSLSELLEFMKI